MMRCDCEERVGVEFKFDEMHSYIKKFLKTRVAEGIFEEIPVKMPYDIWVECESPSCAWYAEKWYRCNVCGTLWEYIIPEFPHEGKIRKFEDGVYIDPFKNAYFKWYQFKPIKKLLTSNFKEGDIFIFNPFSNIYFFGVVLKSRAGVEGEMSESVSICITKKHMIGSLHSIVVPKIEEDDIILKPYIVPKSYWTDYGYFCDLGKSVGDKFKLDYGFYSELKNLYVNEFENTIEREPKFKGRFGMTSDLDIALDLQYGLLSVTQRSSSEYIKNIILNSEATEIHNDFLSDIFDNLPPLGRIVSELEKEVYPFATYADTSASRIWEGMISESEFVEYKYIFDVHEKNVKGKGSDWEQLIKTYLKENFPEEGVRIKFNTTDRMVNMYSTKVELMRKVLRGLSKELRENKLEKYVVMAKFSEYE